MNEFNNTPNPSVEVEGKETWISRSVAVMVIVIAVNEEGKRFVLLGKRGIGTPDFQGYWNMPCGYLDWNEEAMDAAVREVYEETGFLIPVSDRYQMKQPWFVDSDISGRQNVTLRYAVEIEIVNENLPALSIEHCEPDEVEDVKWTPLRDAIKMNLAFGHTDILIDHEFDSRF